MHCELKIKKKIFPNKTEEQNTSGIMYVHVYLHRAERGGKEDVQLLVLFTFVHKYETLSDKFVRLIC